MAYLICAINPNALLKFKLNIPDFMCMLSLSEKGDIRTNMQPSKPTTYHEGSVRESVVLMEFSMKIHSKNGMEF